MNKKSLKILSRIFLAVFVLVFLLSYWWLWTLFNRQQGVIDYLRENQYTMVWQMDKSCFDQIKNNADGILRLKVGE